jgi:hypothetical protein
MLDCQLWDLCVSRRRKRVLAETKEARYASMAPLTGGCATALPETAKSNVFIQFLTDIRQVSKTK